MRPVIEADAPDHLFTELFVCIAWQPWMIVLYMFAFANCVSAFMVLVDDRFTSFAFHKLDIDVCHQSTITAL